MIKRLRRYQDDRYHRPHDVWIELPVSTIGENDQDAASPKRMRSWRKKRQIFTASCTAFTIGCLMLLFASPDRNHHLAPGPLCSSHAQILAGQGADRCAACHGAANGNLTSWISSTFAMGKQQGLSQSELCMKCHTSTILAEHALNPHNVAPSELAELTDKHATLGSTPGMSMVGLSAPIHGHQIACSACHREHRGAQQDLAAMTDQQCQSCHQRDFHDFASGHPEFVNYAQNRRSRIAFDHSTHSLKHFPAKQADFNCQQCHLDDSFQNVKQLASFQQACSSCHDQQIKTSSESGLALLALPMLDTDAIESASLSLGSWPIAATGDFDGPIPPIMRVLLSADSEAAKILNQRGADFDFADLDPTKRDDVQDAVGLAWSIKRLLADLSQNGSTEVAARLKTVTGIEVDDAEIQAMASQLDESVFQSAIQRWMPNLLAEVAAAQLTPDKLTFTAPDGSGESTSLEKKRFWWPSEEDLLLRMGNDDEWLATNPLNHLMPQKESPARPTPVIRTPVERPPQTTQGASSQSPSNQTNADARVNPVPVRVKNLHANPMNQPDLLAVNPLAQLKKPPITPSPHEVGPKIIEPPLPTPGMVNQPHQDQAASDNSPADALVPLTADSPEVSDAAQTIIRVNEPESQSFTGWLRNDQLFRISYRPVGHADLCLQSWMEFVARIPDVESRIETTSLFNKTLLISSIGTCRNCHTMDRQLDSTFDIQWKAKYRDPSIRSFTRFAHGPHTMQPHLQDCSHCHQLNTTVSNFELLQSVDATANVSNFAPIIKSNCSTCHRPGQTDSGCTQCHNYHVGSRVIGTK